MEMNISQQLFAIFFAIIWGTSANAWLKWKPFHWPFVCRSDRIRLRTELSFLFFNLIPVYYFTWIQYALRGSLKTNPFLTFGSVCQLMLSTIVPAFAVFGFYHVWIGLIELCLTRFYYRDEQELAKNVKRNVSHKTEPTIKSLRLRTWTSSGNLIVGFGYIAVALLALLLKLR